MPAAYQKTIEMKLGLTAVILIISILFLSKASAQSRQEDSASVQTALANTLSVYYDQLGDQSEIYNGTLFPEFEFTFQKGNPFFLSDKPSQGSVVYDSISYPGLSLLFDDYRQFVVAVDQSFKLKLINRRISQFTIAGHNFVQMPVDILSNGLPYDGFYEILYNGRSRLLKRTYKKMREVIASPEGISRYLDETDYYFLQRGNSFVPVNTRRELLNFVKDHRKEIQKFVRKKDLSYNENKENTWLQVAAYYDQLDNQ